MIDFILIVPFWIFCRLASIPNMYKTWSGYNSGQDG